MDKVRTNLREVVKARGFNLTELSRRINRNPTYLQQFITKGSPRKLAEDDRRQLAAILGIPESDLGGKADFGNNALPEFRIGSTIPVLGDAKAGAWLELAQVDEPIDSGIAIGPDPEFPEGSQYLLRVVGNSISNLIPNGSYAHCVDFAAVGREPKDGELVHVERIRHNEGLHEITIKQYRIVRGRPELWPNSHDPRHQKPIPLANGTEDLTVEIRGIVIGKYERL